MCVWMNWRWVLKDEGEEEQEEGTGVDNASFAIGDF